MRGCKNKGRLPKKRAGCHACECVCLPIAMKNRKRRERLVDAVRNLYRKNRKRTDTRGAETEVSAPEMLKCITVAKKLPKYLQGNNFFVTFASSEMTK